MSLMRASGRGDEHFDPANVARLSGRRLREFPAGYVYAASPTRDGEPMPAATREDALAVLSRLAHGVDASRLMERVAGREDAAELRSVLCEIGARALTDGRGL